MQKIEIDESNILQYVLNFFLTGHSNYNCISMWYKNNEIEIDVQLLLNVGLLPTLLDQ